MGTNSYQTKGNNPGYHPGSEANMNDVNFDPGIEQGSNKMFRIHTARERRCRLVAVGFLVGGVLAVIGVGIYLGINKGTTTEPGAATYRVAFEYNITRTWNDLPVDHDVITMNLTPYPDGVKLVIEAPFFDDPPSPGSPPGQPFYGLWDYEVVEMFFLNDQNHYLETEFCPHGQHLLLLLNAERRSFKDQLPLNFTTTISGSHWSGEATIPSGYFPYAVTKMNAYAIHGSDENRTYESLYPTPFGQYEDPDFHRLEYFEPINFIQLDPTNVGDGYSTNVWFVYEINTTWNNQSISHDVVQVTLVTHEEGVKLLIEAPFFNDPPNPGGPPGQPFDGLWQYEVVEMFFLNDHDHYVELEFCPHGQHLVLLLNGTKSVFEEQLPLNFTSVISGSHWSGEAIIPSGYFPYSVTKMNAYAIHGSDENRTYEALYPSPHGQHENPDFHRLEYFQPLDFIHLDPTNAGDEYDSVYWT